MFPEELETKYEVDRLLGEGGYGRVFLAKDRSLGRSVAIKVLDSAFADPSQLDRFRREARVTSQLEHPHIVTLYDFGDLPEGRAFIAYEYVRGRDLAALLEDGTPVSPAQVVDWGVKVAQALQVAHDAGVVHRDLKPANVLLREDGAPLLCDFGVARMAGGGGTVHTQEGMILGTPSYVAPEVWKGASPGALADQFAWAATLYELLYRRRAQPLDDPQRIWEALKAGWRATIPDRHAGKLPRLERCLLRALAVRPEDRYPSMKAFAAALAKGEVTSSFQSPAARATRGEATRLSELPALPLAAAGSTRMTGRLGLSQLSEVGSSRSWALGMAALVGVGVVGVGVLWGLSGSSPTPNLPPAATAAAPPASAEREAREAFADAYRRCRSTFGDVAAYVPSWRRREEVQARLPRLVDARLSLGLRRYFDALLPWIEALAAHPAPLPTEARALLDEAALGFTEQLAADLRWLIFYGRRVVLTDVDISSLEMNRGDFVLRMQDLQRSTRALFDAAIERLEAIEDLPDHLVTPCLLLRTALKLQIERWGKDEFGDLADELARRLGEERDPRHRLLLRRTGLQVTRYATGNDRACELRQRLYGRLLPAPEDLPRDRSPESLDLLNYAARLLARRLALCWGNQAPEDPARLDDLLDRLEAAAPGDPDSLSQIFANVLDAFYDARAVQPKPGELTTRIERVRALRARAKEAARTP